MPESTAPETDEERIERIKSCAQCGTGFSCYTSECWCNDLPQIMPLDQLRGCLCPVCLEKTIDAKFKERGLTR
ncbi:MAG TPA: hypothetical protein VNZ86_18000 [Bacteroidia bacterium]|nr:hypothetical protein [Bacteroidia bacterium]